MNKKIISLVAVAFFTMPLLAMAAPLNPAAPPGLPNVTNNLWAVIVGILSFIWPIFIGISILMFLIAGFLFVTANGEANKIEQAKKAMIWGVVGVVVGILSFSLPMIIGNTFVVAV